MDFPFLSATMLRLLAVLPLTLELWALSILFGGLLALGLTWMRGRKDKILPNMARAYVFVFRGTPLLVQLFLIYYGLGSMKEVQQSFLWPFLREPFYCAVLALAMNTAAYSSEIFRGALAAVPYGQIEAAIACGMSRWMRFRRIVFPIALRQALPAYSTEIILMTKATELGSLVTLMEVTGIAQKIKNDTYRALEVYLCAGLIYLVLNFAIARAMAALEYYLSPHLRAIPASRQSPNPAIVL